MPVIQVLPVYHSIPASRGAATILSSLRPAYGRLRVAKPLVQSPSKLARHSLLGNCGYQLVFGANDQASAEYVSRALGKRTVRYQSESRVR